MRKTNLAIDFQWSKGRAYEVVVSRGSRSKDDPLSASHVREAMIRQKGKACDRVRPLEVHNNLYLEFVHLDGSAAACAAFAAKWGLLKTRYGDAPEPLSMWRAEIKRMKDTLEGLRRAFEEKHPIAMRGAHIVPVDVKLIPGQPDGRPSLALEPQTLIHAMRLQLAQNIAGGNTLHTCEQCGQPFESGATAKRIMAKFCSDECRKRFHYEHRRSK
jgi:hypothetical protein